MTTIAPPIRATRPAVDVCQSNTVETDYERGLRSNPAVCDSGGSDGLQLVQLCSFLQQEALLVQRADQALKVHHLKYKEHD